MQTLFQFVYFVLNNINSLDIKHSQIFKNNTLKTYFIVEIVIKCTSNFSKNVLVNYLKHILFQKSQGVPVFQAVVWFSKNTRSNNISDDYTHLSFRLH